MGNEYDEYEQKNVWFIIAATLILALIFVMFMLPVAAHDHEHPEFNGWLESLHNGSGGPCCDGTDSVRIDDADWDIKDGHYRVRLDGEWVEVPDNAVVRGPNRAGRTMVWPYWVDGHPRARCFMPGTMS